MRSMATLVGLIMALGAAYVVYTRSASGVAGTQAPPQQTIDVIDIRTNLQNIGQAERMYLNAHGTYGTLDELNQDGPPTIPVENRGYVFRATVDGARAFTVTATPADSAKTGWPTLSIDERMTVTEK